MAVLRITLRQMEVFVAVAQKGTVTEAAELTGMSQSSASMALAEFEHQLGTQLFDRIGKRVALNDAGRSLYPKAVEMLDRGRELEAFFERPDQEAEFVVGASSTIGNYVLPGLIGKFMARHRGTRIRLVVGNTRMVIDAVRRFEIDVGFVEGPCHDADIEPAVWRPDRLAVCASPHDRLATLPRVQPADLLAAGWILRESGSGTREVVEEMLETQLGEIRVAMELGDTEAIKRAVEARLGISCLPKVALAEAVERGTLVMLRTPFLHLTRQFHILLHKQKYRTKSLQQLLDFCEKQRGGTPEA